MSISVLDDLARALGPILERQKAQQYATSFKNDVSSTSPSTAQYTHGPGGLLTFPGVDPVVFSAAMGSKSLLSQLPTKPSLYMNPTYLTLTGVRDETGNEPDGPCDDGPVAGLMKGCVTSSVFGRYQRATPILDLTRLGQLVDRADPMDLRLVGSPMAQTGPFNGLPSDAPVADVLTNEVSRKFWERNVAFHRLLSRQLWTGNPANNSAGGGYREMTGLELLVNTGYVDIETGVACPAVDSYVRSFAYQRTDTQSGADNLVAAITDMYYQVRHRADSMGLSPVRWAFVMRSQLFYEITKIWPCSYLSFRCLLDGNSANRNNIDASDAVALRDAMMAGSYLLIDGERVDVIQDDAVPELSGNDSGGNFPGGCFSTDIYLLPFSVVGGQSVLFMEYFQWQNPSIQDALGRLVLGRIEGAFITWPDQTNLCVKWESLIAPRLVLRTPWLAARLDNVVYCPIRHVRSSFPDEPYFTDGGKSHREGPSYYTLWGQ